MTLRALIVMAKAPEPEMTKTRLVPPLSPQQAADLYACLLQDTLQSMREAAALLPITPIVAYYPAQAEDYFRDLAPDFQRIMQRGQTLSERLESVMTAVQARGYDEIAAVNSDSPGIPPAYLTGAFETLAETNVDAVFGPCDDGGYYLIGWKRPYSRLLREVTMSTTHVLQDTLSIARQEGIRTALLPPWYDVDNEADLRRLQADENAGEKTREFLATL